MIFYITFFHRNILDVIIDCICWMAREFTLKHWHCVYSWGLFPTLCMHVLISFQTCGTGLMIQVLFSHMYLTVFTKSERSQGKFLLCCCCCLSAVPVSSGKERRRCDIIGTDSRRFQHRSSSVEANCGFYGVREMKLLHEHWKENLQIIPERLFRQKSPVVLRLLGSPHKNKDWRETHTYLVVGSTEAKYVSHWLCDLHMTQQLHKYVFMKIHVPLRSVDTITDLK